MTIICHTCGTTISVKPEPRIGNDYFCSTPCFITALENNRDVADEQHHPKTQGTTRIS